MKGGGEGKMRKGRGDERKGERGGCVMFFWGRGVDASVGNQTVVLRN